MAHAKRIDEAFQCDGPPLLDRSEQIAHRSLAIAFDVLQLDPAVARRQREDIGRLLDPALLEEERDLLFAEPIDVEGAARGEQFQMFDLLVGAGKLAAAAGPRALLAGRGFLAHYIGVQRTRALLREMKLFRVLRSLVDHD